MAPIDINNQEIDSITLNGNTDIDTVEVNGQEVFSSGPTLVSNGDFETGDLTSWTPFDRGKHTVTTTTNAINGSHSLFMRENASSPRAVCESTQTINVDPLTIRSEYRYDGTTDDIQLVHFGVVDANDNYFSGGMARLKVFQLRIAAGSANDSLTNSFFDFINSSHGTSGTFEFTIDTSSSTATFGIVGENSISRTDSAFGNAQPPFRVFFWNIETLARHDDVSIVE